jgi:hypothetical protein
MAKETHHDIYEACCFMQLKKNPEVLDFSWYETFRKKVEKNCALSPPCDGDQ